MTIAHHAQIDDIKRSESMKRGGHFPEWEVPHVVADDLRRFFAERQ